MEWERGGSGLGIVGVGWRGWGGLQGERVVGGGPGVDSRGAIQRRGWAPQRLDLSGLRACAPAGAWDQEASTETAAMQQFSPIHFI